MTRCEMHFVLDHGKSKTQEWSNWEWKGGRKDMVLSKCLVMKEMEG